MPITHRALTSPDRLIPAMRSGMGGVVGLNTGEGSSEDTPKDGLLRNTFLDSVGKAYSRDGAEGDTQKDVLKKKWLELAYTHYRSHDIRRPDGVAPYCLH